MRRLRPANAGQSKDSEQQPPAPPLSFLPISKRRTVQAFGDPLQSSEPTTVPAALYRLADVVGAESRCTMLREIDAPLGSRLSFEAQAWARGADARVILRWSDEALGARRDLAEAQGLRLTVTAECSEGLAAWVCDGCDGLDACAPLCDAFGTPTEEAALPIDPVWRFVWQDGSSQVLSVSFNVAESPP